MSCINGNGFAGGGLSVLVVEDDRDTRESSAQLITMFGHSVRVAENAGVAMRLIQLSAPDVVFIDIGLPGISGYEFARQLRNCNWERKPLLIAVSGYGTTDARQRSLEAGIDLHITKPWDPNTVNAMLKNFAEITRSASSADGMASTAAAKK